MPRRPERDDYLSPGQTIAFDAPTSDAKAPLDPRQWSCMKCGGRQFKVDLRKPSVDPTYAIGNCAEMIRKRRCTGTLARLVAG